MSVFKNWNFDLFGFGYIMMDMYQIPESFKQFISLDCDRKAFIQNYLNAAGIDAPVISLEGKNHIYVKFSQNQYNPNFKIKTVIAHYDRAFQTPGANDNSAAVFCMLEWAVRLNKMNGFHNIRLIFTDGEELGSEGVASQGSFPLAALFRKLGIVNEDIFVFDCMGRGDVPILTQTVLPKGVSKQFVKNFTQLEVRAQQLIKSAGGGKWFSLPCNYSDNASFIANGIPAVAITLLPSEEVSLALRGQPVPTWQLFHTSDDNLESLTPSSFELTSIILNQLSLLKTFIG